MRLAEPAAALVWPSWDLTDPMAHHGQFQTTDFGSVTGLGAGAVGFDELNGFGAITGLIIGAAEGLGLSGREGGIDGRAATIRT